MQTWLEKGNNGNEQKKKRRRKKNVFLLKYGRQTGRNIEKSQVNVGKMPFSIEKTNKGKRKQFL